VSGLRKILEANIVEFFLTPGFMKPAPATGNIDQSVENPAQFLHLRFRPFEDLQVDVFEVMGNRDLRFQFQERTAGVI
jgi:hypothetical protein